MRNQNVKWLYWIQWMLATTVGTIVGFGIEMMALNLADHLVVYAASWVLFGACVGTAQWFVLRKEFNGNKSWIKASVIGWAIGGAVFLIVFWIIEMIYRRTTTADSLEAGLGAFFTGWLIGRIAGGIAVGVLQRSLLCRRVQRTNWWVLANVVGWNAGLGVCLAIDRLLTGTDWYTDLFEDIIVSGAVIGTVAGAVTGGVLIWLLGHPLPETQVRGEGVA